MFTRPLGAFVWALEMFGQESGGGQSIDGAVSRIAHELCRPPSDESERCCGGASSPAVGTPRPDLNTASRAPEGGHGHWGELKPRERRSPKDLNDG